MEILACGPSFLTPPPIFSPGPSLPSCAAPRSPPHCAQVLENMSRAQLTEHLADILPPVQAGLCDSDPEVRGEGMCGMVFEGSLGRGGRWRWLGSLLPLTACGCAVDLLCR